MSLATIERLEPSQKVATEDHKNGSGDGRLKIEATCITNTVDPETESLFRCLGKNSWERNMQGFDNPDEPTDELTAGASEQLAERVFLECFYNYERGCGRRVFISGGLIPNDDALTQMVLTTPKEYIAHAKYFDNLAKMSIERIRSNTRKN